MRGHTHRFTLCTERRQFFEVLKSLLRKCITQSILSLVCCQFRQQTSKQAAKGPARSCFESKIALKDKDLISREIWRHLAARVAVARRDKHSNATLQQFFLSFEDVPTCWFAFPQIVSCLLVGYGVARLSLPM